MSAQKIDSMIQSSLPNEGRIEEKMALSRTVRLYWDIETVPNEQALKFVETPKAPKNLKDPDKIEAAVTEKLEEIVNNAGLDPDLCSIRTIAYALGLNGEVKVDIVNKKRKEADVINDFWEAFARCSGNSVGYNIIAFDFPIVLRRSFDLGLKVPFLPNLIRYRNEPTTDLMQILSGWDWKFSKKLKWICKRYGIPVPAGDDDGSMVSEMSDKQLKIYAESDVTITRELYRRMNGIYFVH
jgi:predicted PolB exonuclease-like 3'-5' exonuclease